MKLDIGFIVLCPDKDPYGLKHTVNSLHWVAMTPDVLCVVPGAIATKELTVMEQICPIYQGGDTITSLINMGMEKLQHDWGFILYSGSCLKTNLQRKLELFIKGDRDVLFPIVNRKTNFVEGSSNGILMSKKLFKDVGNFPSPRKSNGMLNDFEVAKLLWADEASRKGCQFKAVIGLKIC